ncbi:MAG TPA: hypothetical protein VF559_08610 [Caulobacteraceae bacterium]|jgi:hypothetical protein
MADYDFERRLERMFAEVPHFGDANAFAQAVESKLDRSWAMRRMMIGAAGLVGGLIFAAQTLGAGLTQRMEGLGGELLADVSQRFTLAPELKAASYLPYSAEVLWMGVGLAVLAVALVATRALEEF